MQYTREPLINSESFSCVGKMRQIKAPIVGNSKAIAKIGNAELAYFNKQMLIHELIRGSLVYMSTFDAGIGQIRGELNSYHH